MAIYTDNSKDSEKLTNISNENQIRALEMVSDAFRKILEALKLAYNLNIEDPNFLETPQRFARSLILEKCRGINSKKKCIEILSKTFPAMGHENDQLIITTNPAIVYSLCPHHFEVVKYYVWSGYLPDKVFCGLSKFNRVVELYAAQPILQESFTSGLADIIMEALNPKGVIVIVKGSHNCMITRGVKGNPKQLIVTSALRGEFIECPTLKDEFISLTNGLQETSI